MKGYLLDTGPLAAYLLGRSKAISRIDPLINNEEVATSIVVYGEVVEYIKTMPNYLALHHDLRRQLASIRPLMITYRIMELYADIRLRMRAPQGAGVLQDSDSLIAATALRYGLTVIAATALRYGLTVLTNNKRDFERVPGLPVEKLTTR